MFSHLNGWEIEDNDPRMKGRFLTLEGAVVQHGCISHYMTKDPQGRSFRIKADRVFMDARPRRYGFNLRMRSHES